MFFINKYYNKKRLGGPQKMPSKLCKLICNASKIQIKTYVKCVYALINQLITMSVSYYTTKLFARIIIRAVLKLTHPALGKFYYCANFNTNNLKVVRKFLPAQFSWILCEYLQSSFVRSKRSYRRKLTAHCVCRNADLN